MRVPVGTEANGFGVFRRNIIASESQAVVSTYFLPR